MTARNTSPFSGYSFVSKVLNLKEKSNYLKALQVIEQTSSISISAVFYWSLEFPPRDFASRHARLTEQQGKLSKGS